jgi:hypothetical protein
MQVLGARFRQLGDIAAKELAGLPLAESDYQLIQAPLGFAEERLQMSQKLSLLGRGEALEMPPLPVIVSLSGVGEDILQAGIGRLDRLYVVVPLNGELYIAQGGIYSYYEFPWPAADLLSDLEWRQWLSLSEPDQPGWVDNFLLPGGAPVDVLAFQVGDLYRIAQVGSRLNLRQGPSRNTRVVKQLREGDRVTLIDGPVLAEGFTWWKFRVYPAVGQPIEGWAVESQDWYERAWGQ